MKFAFAFPIITLFLCLVFPFTPTALAGVTERSQGSVSRRSAEFCAESLSSDYSDIDHALRSLRESLSTTPDFRHLSEQTDTALDKLAESMSYLGSTLSDCNEEGAQGYVLQLNSTSTLRDEFSSVFKKLRDTLTEFPQLFTESPEFGEWLGHDTERLEALVAGFLSSPVRN